MNKLQQRKDTIIVQVCVKYYTFGILNVTQVTQQNN